MELMVIYFCCESVSIYANDPPSHPQLQSTKLAEHERPAYVQYDYVRVIKKTIYFENVFGFKENAFAANVERAAESETLHLTFL